MAYKATRILPRSCMGFLFLSLSVHQSVVCRCLLLDTSFLGGGRFPGRLDRSATVLELLLTFQSGILAVLVKMGEKAARVSALASTGRLEVPLGILARSIDDLDVASGDTSVPVTFVHG